MDRPRPIAPGAGGRVAPAPTRRSRAAGRHTPTAVPPMRRSTRNPHRGPGPGRACAIRPRRRSGIASGPRPERKVGRDAARWGRRQGQELVRHRPVPPLAGDDRGSTAFRLRLQRRRRGRRPTRRARGQADRAADRRRGAGHTAPAAARPVVSSVRRPLRGEEGHRGDRRRRASASRRRRHHANGLRWRRPIAAGAGGSGKRRGGYRTRRLALPRRRAGTHGGGLVLAGTQRDRIQRGRRGPAKRCAGSHGARLRGDRFG